MVGLVQLFSTETGEPLAIFPDGVIQMMRVGGTGGLSTKYLARKDASVAAIYGSGWRRARRRWRLPRFGP